MNVLFINRSDSECGNCGLGASPYEDSHDSVLGYSATKPGCGARFTHVSSHYVGGGVEEASREMRPDLIWVDFMDIRDDKSNKIPEFSELAADLKSFPIEGYFDTGMGAYGGAEYVEIPLISHITDNLYVGGYEEPGGLANNMKRFGDDYIGYGHDLGDFFSDVFSLFVWGEYVTGPNTKTHKRKMYDTDELPVDVKAVEEMSDLIVEKLNEGGNVLVHCQAGVNRSNLVAARALMKWKGMTADAAIALLRTRRSRIVLSNTAFVRYLRKLDGDITIGKAWEV